MLSIVTRKLLYLLVINIIVSITNLAKATVYLLPPNNSRLIGNNITHNVTNDNSSLEMISAKYKVGLLAMLEANPGTDPWLPKPGTVLTIPSQMLLPDTPHKDIVINLAELRLYYYPNGKNIVVVYPVGIGQLGRSTPVMVTSITQKISNPTWTPTSNIRKIYFKEQGIVLPTVVPAGLENPMGLFALRLAANDGNYLIHGTNANFGIGMRVSSGCIRLRSEDISHLFKIVSVGTQVKIINEPIKVSAEPDGKFYIEVHQPLSTSITDNPQTLPINFNNHILKFIAHPKINYNIVKQAIKRRSGIPVLINNN